MAINYNELNLSFCEKVTLLLRKMFEEYGYRQYRVSKFEEYDLYMKNKSFLVSDNVLTFTDTTGKLMALKPDVTLSIIKNTRVSDQALEKVYYSESVYRTAPGSQGFKEMQQTGLECIGDITLASVCEVLKLAVNSLFLIQPDYRLDLSHVGFLTGLLEGEENAGELMELLAAKNFENLPKNLRKVAGLYLPIKEAIPVAKKCVRNDTMAKALDELKEIFAALQKMGASDNVYIDFTMPSDMKYYNGIIFKGFVDGVPHAILSGGRYDNLLAKMGKHAGAIGFAVYMDELENIRKEAFSEEEREAAVLKANQTKKRGPKKKIPVVSKDDFLNVALPKGRLGEAAYEIFEKAGYSCPSIKNTNRKLVFENPEKKIRFFWVKPSDVAIYVERGAADIGVAGKDILLEYSPDVYELSDLGIGKCRMAVAGLLDFEDDREKTLRVATKFPHIAREYYASLSREIDIIELHGSIELAPILGLSDVIVDIVETGKTLTENNLEPLETVAQISARLISNKVSYKFKTEAIDELLRSMEND